MSDDGYGSPNSSYLRAWVGLVVCAGVALLAALAATAPASLIRRLPEAAVGGAVEGAVEGAVRAAVYDGTIWHGGATWSGLALRWDIDPAGSVAAGALRYAVTLDGPDTALAGTALLWPQGAALEAVAGRAGWATLAAMLPGVTIDCDQVARVALARVDLAPWPAAAGQITTPPGSCRDLTGGHPDPVPVPALTATATRTPGGTRLEVTTPGTAEPLATATLEPTAGAPQGAAAGAAQGRAGRLVAELTASGAALVPGLTGAVGIELPIISLPGR